MTEEHRSPGVRHRLADRLFHWIMAISVIVLGTTAFLPIIGIKFDWLPIHWITGVVLTISILFHLYRVLVVHGLSGMAPGTDDLREVARGVFGGGNEGLKPAKYDAFQKGYHWAASLTILLIVFTGLLMLAKIDTSFWRRDPSILADNTWGAVYVLHGAGSMLILFLVILHVYFGLLPEHRAYLSAMLRGRGPALARKEKE
jgi:cytochrome b subunit of formate dehydrogenase